MKGNLRAFAASMRIGWEIESNWTNTGLYLLYAAVRPLAMCLVLFYLFKAAVSTGLPGNDPRFLAIFVGNAFFTIFGSLTGGLSWAIISDREHYQLIRYVYIAPTPFIWIIVGRAVTLLLIAASSVAFVLFVGWWLLDLPIGISHIDWPILIAGQILGMLASGGIGLFFAGLLLVTARHSMLLAEGVGGIFLLLCGVLYPTTYLPFYARVLAWFNPLTYWIEASRRAYGLTGFDTALDHLPTWLLMALLAALTAIFLVLGWKAFHRFENLAKRLGKIDQTTNY